MKRKLLMVEDDIDLGASLKRQLDAHDFETLWIKSLKEFSAINTSGVLAAIVDLNLPDGNGFSAVELLKVPTIVMTAMNSPENRLKSAQGGVVDFIPKPFLFQELLIKLDRILKTIKVNLKVNGFSIDFTSRSIESQSGEITFLNDKEFQILKILVEKSPAAMSRDDIMNAMDASEAASHRSIDNVIVKIRQILNDEKHEVIKSIRGVGYQWIGSEREQ